MLPDFVELKDRFQTLTTLRIRSHVQTRDPVLREIRQVIIREGKGGRYQTVEGTEDRTDFKPTIAELQVTPEQILSWTSVEDVLKKVDELGEQMLSKIVPSMFGKLKEVTDRTGNVVDARGAPFSFEIFLKAMDTVEIDFDEETGKPNLPMMVVDPVLGEKLRAILPEWERNEEYTRRLNEVIEKKRQVWNDRESRRKLVD